MKKWSAPWKKKTHHDAEVGSSSHGIPSLLALPTLLTSMDKCLAASLSFLASLRFLYVSRTVLVLLAGYRHDWRFALSLARQVR
jgi:hypothetical protein